MSTGTLEAGEDPQVEDPGEGWEGLEEARAPLVLLPRLREDEVKEVTVILVKMMMWLLTPKFFQFINSM